MKRVDQLTFTRFIAVVVVLFFHGGGGVYLSAINFFPLSPLWISATTGVTYLYALSGFVMVLAHYRPGEKFSFENYWKARLARLYPLYILAFLLVCYYYDITVTTLKMRNTLVNVFMVQAWFHQYSQSYNFPAWSVSVEIFFYAVFPFFALWAYRQSAKKLIWVSVGFWAFTQSVHNALWIRFSPEWMNLLMYFPLFHLSSFILGVAGGIWFLREGREQSVNPRVNLLFLVCGVLLTSVYVVLSDRFTQIPREGQLMAGFLAPFLTLVIVTLAMDKTRLSAILKHPAALALGEISYAMFIFHIPVRWIYERALENSALVNYQVIFDYTYLPLMIAIGFLATFYVDQPLRRWLKKALQPISLPLLFLDLAILSYSVYFSFRFRFDTVRIRDEHYTTLLLTYWSSFMLRTICSMAFKAFTPSILYGSFIQFVRPVFVSVTVGSAAIAAAVYVGYSFGWVKYFPLSVFALDWAVVFALSLCVRYLFRLLGFYFPKPSEA